MHAHKNSSATRLVTTEAAGITSQSWKTSGSDAKVLVYALP